MELGQTIGPETDFAAALDSGRLEVAVEVEDQGEVEVEVEVGVESELEKKPPAVMARVVVRARAAQWDQGTGR